MRVVNTCCVTAEAVAKSRKAVRRAARTAERVLVTGCAANLRGSGLDGVAANVTVLPGPRRARARRGGRLGWAGSAVPGGAAPAFARTRAYVKVQDGCSFACSYCVIPQVRGAEPQPGGRPGAGRGRPPGRPGASRGRPDRHQPGLLPRPRRGHAAGRPDRRRRGRRRHRARAALVDRGEPPDRLPCSTRSPTPASAAHLHVPMQSGSTPCSRAMRRRYTAAGFLAKMERARERVPGREPDERRDRRPPAETDAAFADTLRRGRRGRVHEGARVPVLAAARHRRRGPRPASPPRSSAAARAELRAFSDARGAAHRDGQARPAASGCWSRPPAGAATATT